MAEIGFEREDEEIARYYTKVAPADVFGVWGSELLIRLPLRVAERFMVKDHGWTPETWERSQRKKDKASIVAEIEDYFQFAWEKAIGHRGISASRSVHYFMAWTWLLNDMETFAYLMDARNYPNYGAPMILAVGQKYDLLDFLPSDPIQNAIFMNMAKGEPCGTPECRGGCGKGNPGFFRPIAPPPTQLILPK